MRRLLLLGLVAAAVFAATAQAGYWHRVATARAVHDGFASASFFKSGIPNVRALDLLVASAPSAALVTGGVTCSRGFRVDTYQFTYVLKSGVRRLHVPYWRATCTVWATAEMPNGGGVIVDLMKH